MGSDPNEKTSRGQTPFSSPRPALTRWRLWFILLLVFLTVLLYQPGLFHPYLFDDTEMVSANRHIRSLGNVPQFFRASYWREARPGRSYRPLVESSLALNVALTGDAPVGLRAVNVALLAAVGALAYWLAWRLTRSVLAALLAGLVFLVHPTHLETVTLVKNRSELMAGFFGLLSLLWFLRSWRGGRAWWAWWLASVMALAAALGSKEVALAWPLVLIAAALALAPRDQRGRAALMTLPAWLLAAAFLALLLTAMPDRYLKAPAADHAAVAAFANLGPTGRAAVVIKTVGVNLGLLVWPFPNCADRAFAVPHSLARLDVLAGAGALLLVLALVVWTWRRSTPARFALLWLLMALAPVANLSPDVRRPISEARLFAATVPFALLVGLSLHALLIPSTLRTLPALRTSRSPVPRIDRKRPRLPYPFAASALVVWLIASVAGIETALSSWRSPIDFWARTARQSPTVWRAQYNYGVVLGQNGDYAESVAHLERARALDPDNRDGLYNLTVSLTALARQEEALGRTRDAEGRPNEAQHVYAVARVRFEEARNLMQAVLAREPDDAPAYAALALALSGLGQEQEALAAARTAVDLAPDRSRLWCTYSQVLTAAKRFDDAIVAARRAHGLAPEDPEVWLGLAETLADAGRFEEALTECEAVARRWSARQWGLAAGALAAHIERLRAATSKTSRPAR
jgi:tetratricopeptide (TPR) repeat protein